MNRHRPVLLVAVACCFLNGCAFFGLERKVEVTHELVVTEGGVEYQDIIVGEGPGAQEGERVEVDYVGYLSDGSEFDSSKDRGVTIDFVLGDAPLPGWNAGILGMRAGGRRRISIPPELAYGEQGIPGLVPENEPLVFEIELITITPIEADSPENE